jgi:hypothetical protein
MRTSRVQFTVRSLMVAVVVVAIANAWWPALPFLAVATAIYCVATRVMRLSRAAAVVIACSGCLLVYVALSGPLILVACQIGEQEVHLPLVGATFDSYLPLFQLAGGTGLEAFLIQYVEWWLGGELGYGSKDWLGIRSQTASPGS